MAVRVVLINTCCLCFVGRFLSPLRKTTSFKKPVELHKRKRERNASLGYGIKKLDGRYYQGQLMQMTMMATPNINKELHYLNKEDRLLRWLLVKHRDTKYGLEFLSEEDANSEVNRLHRSSIYDDDEDEDGDEDEDDDDDEYDVDQGGNPTEG
ncbi:PREDICTED: 30S ribosomal [Prunus dulcis]|uniref:PREDICTED: 30S ribosomal n=1 Tax=Prunus dulcis TaxID=3755 RepID=A0A5E4FAA7_PRUDU|nr:PREDICTED: 30S ribosomal [Prunus dulcis]